MELNINITSFDVEIRAIALSKPEGIVAYVSWIFHTPEFDIKITGCTIRRKLFGESQTSILSFEPPAIKGRFKYYKTLFIDEKLLYKKLCQFTIKKYCQESGELYEEHPAEEINLDEVPF